MKVPTLILFTALSVATVTNVYAAREPREPSSWMQREAAEAARAQVEQEAAKRRLEESKIPVNSGAETSAQVESKKQDQLMAERREHFRPGDRDRR